MSSEDTDVLGSVIIARNLSKLGVEYIFGIVGIPVIEVAQACIDIGIRFISFRNEQSAAYVSRVPFNPLLVFSLNGTINQAAAAYGYLSGRPGVCLVVGGPGVIHSMAGVHHAESNGWPFMLLAGSSETYQRDMGAFQELDQVGLLKPHVKQVDSFERPQANLSHDSFLRYAGRPPSLALLPRSLERAFRQSFYGRPGPTYVDLVSLHLAL
jgi:2-hydroxyacyl-CoA lyase 1